MKRFAVFVKSEEPSQVTALADRCKSKSYGYWHRTPNAWVILDPSGILTAATLRDLLRETHTNVHVLVLEIAQGSTWAGFGPNSGPDDMFKWFQTEWQK